LFGLVFTPIFYIVVRNLADRSGQKKLLAAAGQVHDSAPSNTIG
jgi:hypothetical protein